MRKFRVRGPHSNAQFAQAQFQQAQVMGSPTQLADAQLNLQRALDRLNRANSQGGGGFMGRLAGVISSSRLNLGGGGAGIAPLVGKLGGLLGGGSQGGAYVAAITAAVSAMKALADAAEEGGRALKQLSDTAALTGGTGAQAGALRGFGISAEFANSLRERLATDTNAMLAAAQLGVKHVLPSVYGKQNNASVVFDVLDRMRALQRRGGDPTRFARMMGAENLLPLLNMSDRASRSLRKTAEALGDLAERTKTATADFDASKKRMELAGDRLKGASFKAIADRWTVLNNKIADATERFAKNVETPAGQDWIVNMIRAAAVTTGPIGMALVNSLLNYLGAEAKKQAASGNATAANTAAVNKNTTALLKGQIYGGGARAQGAIPAGLSNFMLNQMLQTTAHRLGNWTL